MAQYPIPQFIESEGKIISFLTFRQFFILVGGGSFCLLFYYTLPFWLFTILSIIVGLLVALIGFVKIDNTSVVTILLNSILFLVGSKKYIWQKKESPYPFKVKKNYDVKSIQAESPINRLGVAKKLVELRKK